MTYRKLEAHERKMHGPRFRGEVGSWYGAKWWPLLVFLPEEERGELPPTRPDEQAWEHQFGCTCEVCQRPEALWWKRQKVTRATVPRVGPHSDRR